jgi:hypothetical protein
MRFSDLDPEEAAEHWERTQDALARADAMLGSLAERAEQRQRDGTGFEVRYQERSERYQREDSDRTAAQPPKPVPPAARAPVRPVMDPEASREWNAWADRRIDRKIEAFADALGEEMAKILRERFAKERQALEDRMTKSEEATVSLLLEIERRLAALEARLKTAEERAEPRMRLVAS